MRPESRAVQLLARSLMRDLVASELDARDVIDLAAELVDQAADRIAARHRPNVSNRHRRA